MISRATLISIFFSLLLGGTLSLAQSSTFYVDPAGDDANSGSLTSPWKTLDKACSMANAGTTIIVRGGTYPNNYCHGQAQGTAAQPITLKAYPNETPVFTGTHPFSVALNIFGSFWSVENLTFSDTSLSAVVNVANASEVRLKNLTFKNNNGGELLKVSRSSRVFVQDSSFDTTGIVTDQGQGDCIAVRGSSQVLIQGNTFTKCGHAAVDVMNDNELMSNRVAIRKNIINQLWGGGIYIIRGSANTLVEDNVVLRVGQEVNYPKSCIQVAGTFGIYRRNICAITGPNQAGYALAAYTFAGVVQSPQHNRIYNEVIYGASYVAFQMIQKDVARIDDNKIVNSILYRNKTQGPQEPYWKPGNNYITADSYQSTDAAGVYFPWDVFAKTKFIGNIILHADATGDKPGEPRMVYHQTRQVTDLVWSLAQVQEAFPWSGNREVNPRFVNADAGDFSLAAGSPAIDGGVNLTVTTGSGSSNVIPVEDSAFFSDGWGMIAGDQVRIGSTTGTITLVEPGKITIDRAISFTAGAPVNLAFNGSGPDIGAIESGGVVTSPSPTPTPSATPTPTATPSPLPSPSPSPTPAPTPSGCTMTVNNPAVPQWGSGKLVITFTGLTEPGTVKATATSGQVTVDSTPKQISGTSVIAEILLQAKKKSSSITVSGPCGSQSVMVVVR